MHLTLRRSLSLLWIAALVASLTSGSSTASHASEGVRPRVLDFARRTNRDGSGPWKHEEWAAERAAPGPLHCALVRSEEPARFIAEAPRVAVMVNAGLWDPLRASLELYAQDMAGEGFDVEVYTVSQGTPEEFRVFLQGLHADGLGGCVLIGDLPIAWYEQYGCFDPPYQEEYPCDLFYMDLDGYFEDGDSDGLYDSHSGDVAPDIWVGRLTASPLTFDGAAEVQLLENYLRKNHLYRSGLAPLPDRALAYVDDDWTPRTDYLDILLSGLAEECTAVDDPWTTWDTDYEDRLTHGYEFVHVWVHSDPQHHAFRRPGNLWGNTENWELSAIDPEAYFYVLCACSNARYTSPDYMAGWYVFTESKGLAAFGSTKNGCMIYFHDFYPFLAEQRTLGEAYLNWFRFQAAGGFWRWEECYYYGVTLIGDPTLRPQRRSDVRMIHYDNEWGGPSVGLPNAYGFDLCNTRFTARKSCFLSSVLMLANPTGTPTCRIHIWNSGGTFPTTEIGSLDVELDPGSMGHWVAFDVSELGLQFSEGENFHIGISIVDPEPGEQIALHGGVWVDSLPPRSSMRHQGNWVMFNEVVPGGHNFDIRALVVEPPEPSIEITTLTLPEASVGVQYSQTLQVAGGTPPYFWDLTAGELPDGVMLDGSAGIISGEPTTADTARFTVRATDSSNPSLSDVQHLTLAVHDSSGAEPPTRLALRQNYPNPFHPSTLIQFDLHARCHVTVEIINILGQRVRTLVDRVESAGTCSVEWDGRSDDGSRLASGVYFCRVRANGQDDVKKMLLLK